MNTDLTLLVCLTAPAIILILVFVLIETKIMEIILPTIAFIVTVWEWRKKKARDAMREID